MGFRRAHFTVSFREKNSAPKVESILCPAFATPSGSQPQRGVSNTIKCI
uniref:Protein xylosyltransferase n=1 Tax=Mesocestoides corti TaxID=53468 RepID=A0A5K3G4Q6_MESCO